MMKDLVKKLPEGPGIYKMLDQEGTVIYVGKAKNLRARVKNYFRRDDALSTRTKKLRAGIHDIAFIETDSELEALILETTLIKKLRPRYNILMKDDKSFVYIKVDLREDFPRIRVVREKDISPEEKRDPRVRLFGPKLASSHVYETLRILKKLFPFRHCRLDIEWRQKGPAQAALDQGGNVSEPEIIEPNKNIVHVTNRVIDFPCLDYFIKRCPGPCIGAIAPNEYKKIVQQIVDFLDGKNSELEKHLTEQMQEAAENKLFERAARIRDKLFAIQSITQRQKVSNPHRIDTDVINFWPDVGRVYFSVLMIRGGKLINQENFTLDALEIDEKSATIECNYILEAFISQYYEKAAEIPKEILVSEPPASKEALESWLTNKLTSSVRIITPGRGTKNHLLTLALKNATSFGKQYRLKWLAKEQMDGALSDLANVLNMKDVKPTRIEGFDISHLGGNETVGSMVVFEKGLAKSSDYRHFKLRTVAGKPDDYKSMEEVIMRRLKYLTAAKEDREIKIRTPSKKEFAQVQELLKKENLSDDHLNQKDFLVARRGAKIIGCGRLFALDPKLSCMGSLWVAQEERNHELGYRIMKKLIARSKLKRIYLTTTKNFEEYHAVFGFVLLRDVPPALLKRVGEFKKSPEQQGRPVTSAHDGIFMVYESAKHKVDSSFTARPDLIVVDGGKGQLGVAMHALKRLHLEIPVISLAKRLEEIYLPGAQAPLLLEEGDEALKLLQRIRDESHRFAITFQRKLHGKGLLEV